MTDSKGPYRVELAIGGYAVENSRRTPVYHNRRHVRCQTVAEHMNLAHHTARREAMEELKDAILLAIKERRDGDGRRPDEFDTCNWMAGMVVKSCYRALLNGAGEKENDNERL